LVRAGKISDEMLLVLQNDIASGAGDTIGGTGGLKKTRLAASGGGKRGGWRVIFADYPAVGRTALLMAFSKSDKADLTPSEKDELREVKRFLDRTIGV
jgi:hypothetical protein